MNHALSRLLSRLHGRGALSLDEGARLRRDVRPDDLPAEGPPLALTPALEDEALRFFGAIYHHHSDDAAVLAGVLRTLTPPECDRLHESAQDAFDLRAKQLAWMLAVGEAPGPRQHAFGVARALHKLAVAAWHAAMRGLVAAHLTLQMALGGQAAGGASGAPSRPAAGSAAPPRPYRTLESTAELEALLRREGGYLDRWADGIALERLRGAALSVGEVERRAVLYGGVGRGEYYKVAEGGRGEGWVASYECRDDPASCIPCMESVGHYLPSRGPMPGQVCMGRGRCRCRRVLVYLPDEWARLSGIVS